MSTEKYFNAAQELVQQIRDRQKDSIEKAAAILADSISQSRWAYLFGSGHSVLPVMDVFPRYGSFVGFRPLIDPRLIWFTAVGPGGAPELLWIERQEGYIQNFLNSFDFQKGDSLLVYSHGGLNAAPIEAAIYAKERGCQVVAVTSMENHRASEARHSSGKKLADLGDVVIDNCVSPEDAQVEVGQVEKLAAGSTLAVILITMALVAETGSRLRSQGFHLDTFVSPNVAGVDRMHNARVFERYRERLRGR
ncbi:MAG: sugar isomerase domain-containing protein [Acidobacteriota bacterium]